MRYKRTPNFLPKKNISLGSSRRRAHVPAQWLLRPMGRGLRAHGALPGLREPAAHGRPGPEPAQHEQPPLPGPPKTGFLFLRRAASETCICQEKRSEVFRQKYILGQQKSSVETIDVFSSFFVRWCFALSWTCSYSNSSAQPKGCAFWPKHQVGLGPKSIFGLQHQHKLYTMFTIVYKMM